MGCFELRQLQSVYDVSAQRLPVFYVGHWIMTTRAPASHGYDHVVQNMCEYLHCTMVDLLDTMSVPFTATHTDELTRSGECVLLVLCIWTR